jgi:integrase
MKTFVAPSTINRELGILRNMLRVSSEWYDLDLKPLKFEIAKEEQKERIFSESKIRRLIDNSNTPLRYIIMVAINTGVRKSEILNLEWDQVNLEVEFITVVAQKSKTRRIRRIPLNHSMSELFYKLILSRNGNRYIFIDIL